jgi:MFS family permease
MGYVYSPLLLITNTYSFTGRRVGMMISAIVVITGTAIQATCHNLAGFMIGRFILGFGSSLNITVGTSYTSEMAHPAF